MKSIQYLEQLKAIPCEKQDYDLKSLIQVIKSQKKESIAIEVGIATEIGLLYAFNEFNVDDNIAEGFASQYPNLAENQSLYQDLLAKGADTDIENLTSYIDRIKGKIYEIELTDRLGEQFDGYTFSIAESATQPIWDIKGVNADGQEILVQAKMGGENYAYEVKDRMLENPDVLFATSTEIQDKILSMHPELVNQFVNIDISNAEFSTQIVENAEQLIANHGADFFDSSAEYIPVLGEIIVGIKLLSEMSKVNNEYQGIPKSQQDKIKMIKAIVYLSRYGVTSALISASASTAVTVAGFLGSLIDIGTGGATLGGGAKIAVMLAGAGAGAALSKEINEKIEPHMYDMALGIMDYTRDDMFYFKNKTKIDDIGDNLYQSYLLLSSSRGAVK